jgi:hypothetical protein
MENYYKGLYKKFGFKEVKGIRKFKSCIFKMSNGYIDIYFYNNGNIRLGKLFNNCYNVDYYGIYKMNNKKVCNNLEDMYKYILGYLINKYYLNKNKFGYYKKLYKIY